MVDVGIFTGNPILAGSCFFYWILGDLTRGVTQLMSMSCS